MRSFCHRTVAVVVVGLLSSGCVMEPLDEELANPPPLTTLGGGTTGGNGLPPGPYQLRKFLLNDLFRYRTLPPPGGLSSNPYFSNLISTPDGALLFKYAIECALPQGQSIDGFAGAGWMATTGSWVSGPLNQQQRNDVHTCITTRLNPSGQQVPIWIGGPNTGKTSGAEAYPYFEAVWSVTLGATWSTFSVWPSGTLLRGTTCSTMPDNPMPIELDSRVCDTNPVGCHVNLRTDFASACQGQPGQGNFMCDGKPAIETRLTKASWNLIHPLCKLP